MLFFVFFGGGCRSDVSVLFVVVKRNFLNLFLRLSVQRKEKT